MAAHAAGRQVGLGAMVLGAAPDYAESVIARALEFRANASRGARNALDRELDNCVRVNNFQHASKAPVSWLKGPVMDALEEDRGNVAAALLGVWAESRPELRDAVSEHLDGGAANGSTSAASLSWSLGELDEAIQAVVGEHGELDEPDVAVMLCFVSGRCVQDENPAAEIKSPLLLEFLERLEALDPSAADWQDLPHFVDAVAELDDMRAERATDTAIAGVQALVDTALQDYGEELAYLDLHSQVSGWAEEAALKAWMIADALAVVEGLLERLEDYRPIRPQAGTRTEEEARARKRSAAEDGILEIAASWRELMDQPLDEGEEVLDDAWDDVMQDGPAAVGEELLSEEIEALRTEVERLRRHGEKRQSEFEGVTKEKADLAAERDALQADIARLNDELSDSRDSGEDMEARRCVRQNGGGGSVGQRA